jgi:hypothetical protein
MATVSDYTEVTKLLLAHKADVMRGPMGATRQCVWRQSMATVKWRIYYASTVGANNQNPPRARIIESTGKTESSNY